MHERWTSSAHRFSSFNNPVYLFSVRETRRVALERELSDLLIHGVLHLLGMDHERPADARHMKTLEEHLRWTLAAFD